MADNGDSEGAKLVGNAADGTGSDSDAPKQASGGGTVMFSSKAGLLLTFISAVGGGSLWRFPRTLANNCGKEGCLQFLLVWLVFLFLWSIPLIIIEVAIGRFTRRAPPMAFHDLLGVKSTWLGGWMASLNFLITCYFGVIVGWAVFYTIECIFYPLPTTYELSIAAWRKFEEESLWPVLLHFIITAACAAANWRGVGSIELTLTAMTPVHLILLLTAFIWSLTLNNAGVGLGFFFTPDWGLLGSPKPWIEALSQVAWDTGAAFGIFLVLGASMTRKMGPVKNVVWTTAINGLISLIVGVTVFCTVFATYTKVNPDGTEADVVNLLRTNGPANTGLTFIWLPILFSTMTGGRVMASLFFLAVVIATFSNYITLMNTTVQAMVDWGVKRSLAVVVIATLTFLLGVPSAVNIHVLVNQDFVWSAGLIFSGLSMIFLLWKYGAKNFRLNMLNEGEDGSDWKLQGAFDYLTKYVLLLNGLALLVWWVVHTIQSADVPWYQLGNQSLMTAFLEWFAVGLVLLVLNLLFVRCRARMSGCWSSLIAKQEDIPACRCCHKKDTGDRDNLITATDQAGERQVPDYSTINH
ncbi:sodium-dependent serotonin transporter-like [Branchiostoma floridae]|uniref:Sodium-dependent serotonin transporter-like n=1 Tax=Branchiostoma floridae TaxID=7739 RepID=A0A9J7LQJ4_BRAFL|nr:sodium-dependent serotonin transporter-like [Branchiostoma floridae]